jgi:hypothetical protein
MTCYTAYEGVGIRCFFEKKPAHTPNERVLGTIFEEIINQTQDFMRA